MYKTDADKVTSNDEKILLKNSTDVIVISNNSLMIPNNTKGNGMHIHNKQKREKINRNYEIRIYKLCTKQTYLL